MIRVTIGDVIAEHEGSTSATYYWCHEVHVKPESGGGQTVDMDRVTTINGASIEYQPDLTIITGRPIYIEHREEE